MVERLGVGTVKRLGVGTVKRLGVGTVKRKVAFQSNANHLLAESMGYIKFEEI